MKRTTLSTPGYDCIRSPCRPNCDHGIHNEVWHYTVANDDVAMTLTVSTGRFPDTVPAATIKKLLDRTGAYPRGDALQLHTSYRVNEDDIRNNAPGEECRYLSGGICWSGGSAYRMAEDFFAAQGRPMFEQPETFWLALEAECGMWAIATESKRAMRQCSACKGSGIVTQPAMMADITLKLPEEDRQLVLMALARLSLLHPGLDFALNNVAMKIDNVVDGRASMFDDLRKYRADVTSPEPPPVASLSDEQALLAAATCFRIGRFYVEHIVDTEGHDWGWKVSENGNWEEGEGLTRDQAIAQAREREAKS